jgi:hypothetical protein
MHSTYIVRTQRRNPFRSRHRFGDVQRSSRNIQNECERSAKSFGFVDRERRFKHEIPGFNCVQRPSVFQNRDHKG